MTTNLEYYISRDYGKNWKEVPKEDYEKFEGVKEAKPCKAFVEYFKENPDGSETKVLGEHKDDGKPPMDLLDSRWLEDIAHALAFGARKYSPHNYRYGIHYSRIIASMYRHLSAINRGEDIDPESGLPHVTHLSCNAMFLHVLQRTKPELDDRWKEE